MSNFTSEGFLMVIAVMAFVILFGLMVWMVPWLVEMVILALETQVL